MNNYNYDGETQHAQGDPEMAHSVKAHKGQTGNNEEKYNNIKYEDILQLAFFLTCKNQLNYMKINKSHLY